MSNTLISEIAFALEAFMLDAEARQSRPNTQYPRHGTNSKHLHLLSMR